MYGVSAVSRVGVLFVIASLAGCVTTQGGSMALPQLGSLNVGLSDLTDAFSSQMRELKNLVRASKYSEAEALVLKERDFFWKRAEGKDKSMPEEVKEVGGWVWKTRYAIRTDEVLSQLRTVTSLTDAATWPQVNEKLRRSRALKTEMKEDTLLQMAQLSGPQQKAISAEEVRIASLARSNKEKALASTFEATLSAGKHNPTYIGDESFKPSDYLASTEFQGRALARIRSFSNREAYFSEAIKLRAYLNSQTEASVDAAFVELVRTSFLASGRVSLEQVAELGAVKTPFGGSKDALSKLISIGYVDLTSASFRDRNLFDFEISFKQDMDLAFTPAAESVFNSEEISRFDYLFVTDLAVAKVSRKFVSKRDVSSKTRTGTREVPNPEYVSAMTGYQKAMAEYQRAQINAAIPKPCIGWACALQGVADGMGQAAAKSGVDRASSALASTSQTLSQPVYSSYSYQSVDIDTSRTADVNYYVIDVRRKRILKSSFQVNDNEVFSVAYNVREEDPDKASILRNVKSEEEVTNWEKKPMTIPMSALFGVNSLKAATQAPYTDLQSFLKSLNTRAYAAASPTYSQGREPGAAAQTARGTLADERFDSVVIIQNPKSTGTGFYVTPDLVMTAYHVTEGSSLVEMTFYDGTKTYGKVIDHDVRLDLALIKAQTPGKPLKIHSGPLKLGETVEAIGHPKGYEFTITRGVISALRKQRGAVIGSDALVEFVQTDTAISNGNSGGPLLLKDAVIGVNDWIRVDKGSQNLNFSVSYNEIRAYLDRLKAK